MNQRLTILGHYFIITSDLVRSDQWNSYSDIVSGYPTLVRGHRVFCQGCALCEEFSIGEVPAGITDFEAASDLTKRSLVRFLDKTCEGVRLQLLAEEVMLT